MRKLISLISAAALAIAIPTSASAAVVAPDSTSAEVAATVADIAVEQTLAVVATPATLPALELGSISSTVGGTPSVVTVTSTVNCYALSIRASGSPYLQNVTSGATGASQLDSPLEWAHGSGAFTAITTSDAQIAQGQGGATLPEDDLFTVNYRQSVSASANLVSAELYKLTSIFTAAPC